MWKSAHSLFNSADEALVGGQFSATQAGIASQNEGREA
jgi:hypothetical protein